MKPKLHNSLANTLDAAVSFDDISRFTFLDVNEKDDPVGLIFSQFK